MKIYLKKLMVLTTIASFAVLSAQSQAGLNDAEVANVAVTANQIDIQYAEIAKEKSKNETVLKFASTMERDHKAVIAQAAALAGKLGVVPEDNAVSKKLMTDAQKTMKMLKSKSGAAFDKAYINNEVAYHKAVVEAVEKLLIPDTENAELKQFLSIVLPALKAHLGHAEMIQKEMK